MFPAGVPRFCRVLFPYCPEIPALFPDMFPGHCLAVNGCPCMPLLCKCLIYQ